MKKLTDKTFGRLTVHADGRYSIDGKPIPTRCADVLDACFLLSCTSIVGALNAAQFLMRAKFLPIDSYPPFETSEYVRKHWEWVNT